MIALQSIKNTLNLAKAILLMQTLHIGVHSSDSSSLRSIFELDSILLLYCSVSKYFRQIHFSMFVNCFLEYDLVRLHPIQDSLRISAGVLSDEVSYASLETSKLRLNRG